MVAIADLIPIDGSHNSQAITTTPVTVSLGAGAKRATHIVFTSDVKTHFETGLSGVVCDDSDPSIPGNTTEEFTRRKNRGHTHASVRAATGSGTITWWLGRQHTPRA